MGFSAGVMIFVSFVELIPLCVASNGFTTGILFFFVGMFIMFIIDASITNEYEFGKSFDIISHEYSPVLVHKQKKSSSTNGENGINLRKTSLLLFLGIFIHKLPEGMATFIGAMKDVELGLLLAIAIALHNIPEGIAVSVPIYISSGSRKKAFFWSFLSGLSEFIGALIVGLILFPFIDDHFLGVMLSIVAGIMVYLSLDELLPVAHSLGKEHRAIEGVMLGMFVMFISLAVLRL